MVRSDFRTFVQQRFHSLLPSCWFQRISICRIMSFESPTRPSCPRSPCLSLCTARRAPDTRSSAILSCHPTCISSKLGMAYSVHSSAGACRWGMRSICVRGKQPAPLLRHCPYDRQTYQQLGHRKLLLCLEAPSPAAPQAIDGPFRRQRLAPTLSTTHAVNGEGERWLRAQLVQGPRVVAPDPMLDLQ